jgi:arylsulfatase A-like enzyme
VEALSGAKYAGQVHVLSPDRPYSYPSPLCKKETTMRRPNILILYTDQQRWDALGANGNPEIHTPNLDRLAEESLNFTHCFVQNPLCMPSRISFLTGQYPSTLGITHMAVPVPEDTPTLARLLKSYGYYTANIGKLHFLPHANRDHRAPHPDYGFDHLEISDEPGCYEDAYRAWVRRKAPEHLDNISAGLPQKTAVWQETMNVADGIRHPQERFPKRPVPFQAPDELTHSAFVAEQTSAFLRSQSEDRPFLCIAGFFSPHSPWLVPQSFLDQYDPESFTMPSFPNDIEKRRNDEGFDDSVLRAARHGYYAMVSEVDHHVGQILDTLDESGLKDNTIIVFTSDHGEFLGEHLRWGKGYPSPDCVSRVPLIIRPPQSALIELRSIDTIVEAVDVLPTLLDYAAIQVPPLVQGRSLATMIAGNKTGWHGNENALMEFTGWKSLRTEQYRYIAKAEGQEQLFDLNMPFGEYHNVIDDSRYAIALADMRKQLISRLIDIERPLARTWNY